MIKDQNQYKYNLQKEFIKNFMKNQKISWKQYKAMKNKDFKIDKIENIFWIDQEENILQIQALQVIKNILEEVNKKDKVELTRSDLVILKLFSLFNKSNTTKDISKEQASIILKYFEQYKKQGSMSYEKDYFSSMEVNPFSLEVEDTSGNDAQWDEWTKRNITIKSTTLMNIKEIMESRLLIFKFDDPKLMTSEIMKFQELNNSNILQYTFMPISANIGIMFYQDLSTSIKASTFFNNDIDAYKHEEILINANTIEMKRLAYINEHNPINEDDAKYRSEMFFLYEVDKYHDKKDRFIFDVLKEDSSIADKCNAKLLTKSKSKIIIFQDEQDIIDAEKQMKK